MTTLNTLNKSMQRECHTVIDFTDKVCVFKEKLELAYVKVENKKFDLFPIWNRSFEGLDLEPDLMTSVSFVILKDLYTQKHFENYIPENINSYT